MKKHGIGILIALVMALGLLISYVKNEDTPELEAVLSTQNTVTATGEVGIEVRGLPWSSRSPDLVRRG